MKNYKTIGHPNKVELMYRNSIIGTFANCTEANEYAKKHYSIYKYTLTLRGLKSLKKSIDCPFWGWGCGFDGLFSKIVKLKVTRGGRTMTRYSLKLTEGGEINSLEDWYDYNNRPHCFMMRQLEELI